MSSEIDHADTISYKIMSKGQTIAVIVQDFFSINKVSIVVQNSIHCM